MKSQDNMQQLLDKIEEMRGFFKVGDEIIPFLADLFVFLKDIMPLMSDVNASLREGTHKLPTASDRIADVTQATEMATHEILDKLDSIVNKLNSLAPKLADEDKPIIEDVENETTDIIFALQFQDITSQKLEHAHRILTAIYEKFISLFDTINKLRSNSLMGSTVISSIEEDIDSDDYQEQYKEFDQKTADLIRRQEEISQDDIDKLFG
jgi:chemotaxis regulatin CheY-phosphate phosphatase CheZ